MTESNGPRATLVLGGARSGKSRYAEMLARQTGMDRVYVATGAAHDGEMADRIAEHQSQRGDDWTTIEEQLDLTAVLARECRPGRVVLVDCLTLWLSNLIFADRNIAEETTLISESVSSLKGACVFVSNEVGMGIVPENRLSRTFRDAQGRLNQAMSATCAQVVFVAAGLPLLMKPNSQSDISL